MSVQNEGLVCGGDANCGGKGFTCFPRCSKPSLSPLSGCVSNSAAGSEAPRRFGFCRRGTYEASGSTAARERSKAPSPLRSAGAVQRVPCAGEAVFETGPLVERASVLECGGKRSATPLLDSAEVARMRSALLQPSWNDPKRRRRYALPAQSKASHLLERQ